MPLCGADPAKETDRNANILCVSHTERKSACKRGREILPFCDRDISAGCQKRRGKHCAVGRAEQIRGSRAGNVK